MHYCSMKINRNISFLRLEDPINFFICMIVSSYLKGEPDTKAEQHAANDEHGNVYSTTIDDGTCKEQRTTEQRKSTFNS